MLKNPPPNMSSFSIFFNAAWHYYVEAARYHSFFDSAQLQDIKNFKKPPKQIINLMGKIYSEGLFNAIKTHIPKENFDKFILELRASKNIFNAETALCTKLREVSYKIYQETEGVNLLGTAKYYSALDLMINSTLALKHVCANPVKHKISLKGNDPVIKDGNEFFWISHTANNDWMAITRKDPIKALKNPMNRDIFTYGGNLNTWRQVGQDASEFESNESTLFKNSLDEIYRYYNNLHDNAYLVDKIYGVDGITHN